MFGARSKAVRLLAAPVLAIGCASCVGLGTLGEVLAAPGGVYGRELNGEVRSIDTRRQEIRISSGWGRTDRVRYDGRTVVVYRQRRYSPRDLERGDVVRVRLDDRVRGGPVASRIDVRESIRDRYGRDRSSARLERFDGSVVRIDTRQRTFELRPSRGRTVTVIVPYRTEVSLDRRFQRLRRGDRVRIEGYELGGDRVELRRFY